MDRHFLNNHDAENGRVKLALADIKKSGLSFDILRKAGVTLFSDGLDALKKRLGFGSLNGNPILAVAVLMEIPYRDPQGNISKFEYRLYPETDGRKYLHSLHSSPVPYILPEAWAIMDKVNKPLWITEGVKKVLKLSQHGAACIGLSGVWGFRPGKDKEAANLLCEEMELFEWRGRAVYLVFDIDLWTNPQVRKALYELAFHLVARHALVYIAVWKGAKGIDDHLAEKTDPAQELSEIQNKARLVTSFLVSEHRDDVLYGLSKSVGSMDDLLKESTITAVARKLNIKPKSINRELSKEIVEDSPGVTDQEKEEALKLLRSPNLIRLFLSACHNRYVGRDKVLLLIKLATITRHLSRGLSVVILGTSSVGKSELIETVLMTVDQTATENFSRTSPQYLLYRTKPLEHKIIVFFELNGTGPSVEIMRTAMTEGVLRHGTVLKDASGALCATEINKKTPGLVILSSYTGSQIDAELKTRVLLQEITHEEALAREVFIRKAQRSENDSDIFKVWQIADTLVEARPVVIPYQIRLARVFPTREERFHRDYDKTVMLIKASALLHQHQREQSKDGAVIATEDDYRLVYSLGDAFAQSLLPVSAPVLGMLDVGKKMGTPTREQLQERLQVSSATMKRYIKQAREAELVEVAGKGDKQTITIIDAPMSLTVLPSPDEIFCGIDEPMSQMAQALNLSGSDVAHPSLMRGEPNERLSQTSDRVGSNGSGSSRPSEPGETAVPDSSMPNSSTGHPEDTFVASERDYPDLSHLQVQIEAV